MANTDTSTKAKYKSRVLGDFVRADGLSFQDTFSPQEIEEDRRMGVDIKNQGGGYKDIAITVIQNCESHIKGYDDFFDEFSAFSDDGESGTLEIYTASTNKVTITGVYLTGITREGIYTGTNDGTDKTYIEVTYTFLRSLHS